MVALALALTGCNPRMRLDVHYLPGIVAGSQKVFRPVRVAVPPTAGNFGVPDSEVGMIYTADGTAQAQLMVADAARTFNDALIKGMAGAGLVPVPMDSNANGGRPPEGTDFILASELDQLEVNKRFGSNQTVHGQYFTMNAVVRVKYWLQSRAGAMLYSGEISGIENEPPNPVGHEVFLPLETEPAESLSVALSRAVGLLMVQPGFRAALPTRAVEAAPTSTTTPQTIH